MSTLDPTNESLYDRIDELRDEVAELRARDGEQWMRERTTAATKALNNLPLYNFGLIDGYGRVIPRAEASAA